MKKIIMFIGISLLLSSCISNKNKYTITDSNDNTYGTNFYNTTDDGCIMFNDIGCSCGNSEEPGIPTRLCGSYVVVENKINE
jgi:hypothetical protein